MRSTLFKGVLAVLILALGAAGVAQALNASRARESRPSPKPTQASPEPSPVSDASPASPSPDGSAPPVAATPSLSPKPSAAQAFALSCLLPVREDPSNEGQIGSCTVKASSTFHSPVSLACLDLPPSADSTGGYGCRFTKNPLGPTAGGSQTTEFWVGLGHQTKPFGSFNFRVIGKSGSLSVTATVEWKVAKAQGTFTYTCSPGSLNIKTGESAVTACTFQSHAGLSTPISLSCPTPPAGLACAFSPNPVTPPADGTVTASLTVSVGPDSISGSKTLKIATRNATWTYPDMSVIVNVIRRSISVSCGAIAFDSQHSSVCTVRSVNGFAGVVEVTCKVPVGVKCAMSPTTVNLTADGSAETTVTSEPDPYPGPDSYRVDVLANSAGTSAATYMLIKPPPAIPGFP